MCCHAKKNLGLPSCLDVPLQPQDSPLLALPAETRNKIYSDTLIESDDVTIFCTPELMEQDARGEAPYAFYWQAPALLRTCRQICNEASLLHYTNNSFVTVDTKQWYLKLSNWLAVLEPKNLRALQNVTVDARDEGMIAASFVRDLIHFRDELQPTDLSVPKNVLRMILPVYKAVPTTTRNYFPYEAFYDTVSVAEVERGRIFACALMEDGSGAERRRYDKDREIREREFAEDGLEDGGPQCYMGDVMTVFGDVDIDSRMKRKRRIGGAMVVPIKVDRAGSSYFGIVDLLS